MNIFARELAQVLAEHGKELSYLFSVKSERLAIPPSKVRRLKISLVQGQMATLNADELELLRQLVSLSDAEMRRLHAALVAESVRYTLSGRMQLDHAQQIAELTLDLLTSEKGDEMPALRDTVLEQIRADIAGEASEVVDPIERALEAATGAFEAGTLWLEVARDTRERSTRLGFLAQAESLLKHARTLAAHPATAALNTSQQAELLRSIDAALAQIAELRGAAD
jgi:hypothetical protein